MHIRYLRLRHSTVPSSIVVKSGKCRSQVIKGKRIVLSVCVVHNFEEFSLHLQTRDSIRTLAAQKYTLRIVPGEILLAEATIEVQGVAMSDALPA